MLTVQSSIIIVEDENARSSCNSLDPRLCHVHAEISHLCPNFNRAHLL